MQQASRIRSYRHADLPKIQTVAARAFAPVFTGIRAHVAEPMASLAYGDAEQDQRAHLARLCKSENPSNLLVVERRNRIIGFGHVILDPERRIGEIGINAIDPAYQGQGHGHRLHAAMLERMRSAGMRVATVGTGADDAHAPARRAYDRAGFREQIPSIYLYRAL